VGVEVRLRDPGDLPNRTEFVVHYGSGLEAVDQIITNAVGNYGFYRQIAERKATGEPGALVLSVFACTDGVTLTDLLGSAPAAPYSRHGTATAGEIAEAGWTLWATDVLISGAFVEFSHVHFDIWLPAPDVSVPADLAAVPRPARRQLRDLLRPRFARLLECFEPREER
jgi:hypothetical protein